MTLCIRIEQNHVTSLGEAKQRLLFVFWVLGNIGDSTKPVAQLTLRSPIVGMLLLVAPPRGARLIDDDYKWWRLHTESELVKW